MEKEKNDLLNDNTSSNNNEINDFDYIYEMLFGIVSNIISDQTKLDIKLKQFNILEKLLSNIIIAEKSKKNSEKFRKIRINNPNIDLVLKIKGVYDFFIFLGFKQENNENDENNDIYLYLPDDNISLQKLEKALFYMNLLNLNFIEIDDEDNLNYYETPEYHDKIKENNNIIPQMNINTSSNNEAEKILKETGIDRYNQAMKYTDNDNNNYFTFSYIFNFFTCNKCGKDPKKEAKKFFEHKRKKNEEKKNIMTLSDIEYKNPSINSKNLECKDEIGKDCLKLTNEFRAKYNLLPLEWDDSIWSIAYIHSKNMGEGLVPFGHKGFNERVNQFNFTYYKACENVFMCQGYSQYSISQNAVKGWIYSPGHKKNLLSDTTHCAIAVYKNKYGEFYLTQLFALK
jgi:uncharacterized protein YkwD